MPRRRPTGRFVPAASRPPSRQDAAPTGDVDESNVGAASSRDRSMPPATRHRGRMPLLRCFANQAELFPVRFEVQRATLQIRFDLPEVVLVRQLIPRANLLRRWVDAFAGQQAVPGDAGEVRVEILPLELVADVLAANPGGQQLAQRTRNPLVVAVVSASSPCRCASRSGSGRRCSRARRRSAG